MIQLLYLCGNGLHNAIPLPLSMGLCRAQLTRRFPTHHKCDRRHSNQENHRPSHVAIFRSPSHRPLIELATLLSLWSRWKPEDSRVPTDVVKTFTAYRFDGARFSSFWPISQVICQQAADHEFHGPHPRIAADHDFENHVSSLGNWRTNSARGSGGTKFFLVIR